MICRLFHLLDFFLISLTCHQWSIPNPHWQRAFGLMAAYGISNHELFHVDLDSLLEVPGHLISTYRKNHYGVRRIYCLYPEWYKEWELFKHIDLPQVTGQNNRDLGHRVSTAFRRYGLCKPGDLRHCWAIRAMGFIPDSMAARMMAHKTQVHNDTYKRWIDENDEDRFYQLLKLIGQTDLNLQLSKVQYWWCEDKNRF